MEEQTPGLFSIISPEDEIVTYQYVDDILIRINARFLKNLNWTLPSMRLTKTKSFFITPQSKIRLSMPVKRVENRVFYSREESDRSMQMAVSFCPLAHLYMLH